MRLFSVKRIAAKPVLGGAAAGIACFVVLAVIGHGLFSHTHVVVDGRRVDVQVGETVGEVVARASGAVAGDLLAVRDGRVIVPGGGRPPVIKVDGVRVGPESLVRSGDVIVSDSGCDVVEMSVEETRVIPIPTKVTGTGALVVVESPGREGVQRVVVGAVSRDVVASESIVPAEPMVMRRVGDGDGRVIALTFDDGPWPAQTDAVLKVLADYNVPATFFMTGDRVKRRPDIARRVAKAGHAIGNHTYHHADLTGLPPGKVRSEIAGTNRMITRMTGEKVTWFRPPMGRVDARTYAELKRQKMRPVLWTVDPQDWREGATAAQIERAVVRAARPGSVILLHDGGGDHKEMVKALPRIIRALRSRGYDFVLLDDLETVKGRW
ncbi:MAG: polysaccharide deacetylase family protein [Coriobacteriales bacterium]|nr:polysaccharide deacetylase family protein [Actinomycetes bacterium]